MKKLILAVSVIFVGIILGACNNESNTHEPNDVTTNLTVENENGYEERVQNDNENTEYNYEVDLIESDGIYQLGDTAIINGGSRYHIKGPFQITLSTSIELVSLDSGDFIRIPVTLTTMEERTAGGAVGPDTMRPFLNNHTLFVSFPGTEEHIYLLESYGVYTEEVTTGSRRAVVAQEIRNLGFYETNMVNFGVAHGFPDLLDGAIMTFETYVYIPFHGNGEYSIVIANNRTVDIQSRTLALRKDGEPNASGRVRGVGEDGNLLLEDASSAKFIFAVEF